MQYFNAILDKTQKIPLFAKGIPEMKDITSIKQTDDATLWHLLTEGDRKALEVIYQRYYVLLLNYGLKCTSDRELIKDCIHDLFVNLYHNTRISIEGITIRAYLLKALRNNLFNKLVGLERERDSLDASSFEIPIDEDLFEQMFPQNDRDFALAQHLLKAIAQLSPHQKTALYLRYVKELSHKEIAAIMNINEQSSMNLANRALLKLRSLIKKDGMALEICQTVLLLKSFWILA